MRQAETQLRIGGRALAALGLTALLVCLGGCQEILSGPAAALDQAGTATLAPVARGAETPTYAVTAATAWRLECPPVGPGDGLPKLGAAVVTFPTVAVELELHGFRARLRCIRPKSATQVESLTVCTFGGEVLGQVKIDQEIALEGFLGQHARVTFDIGPVPPPADNSPLSPTAPPPPNKPRMLLDPVDVVHVLNHSTRQLDWLTPAGETVTVKPQERATMQLSEELEALHRTELEARNLRIGRLYSAAKGTLFVIRQADDRLTLLTNQPEAVSVLPLGDQTRLEIPAPAGRIDIEGQWTLVLDSLGRWGLRVGFTRDGRYPVLVNRGDAAIHWISLVSLTDVAVSPATWRQLKPLP